MPNYGIGDPYWFEWYIGLKYVIEMLSPDSEIAITFQKNQGMRKQSGSRAR